ncbi:MULTISPECIES: hypothetical protein [Streptomyces]|uniref:L,D-transpeptidase n=2 Tax=Streptomyces TaxID=1883 RepID=A0A646KGU1_STRJU|nr:MULTISPECIES: hypothetical protein [Streptomyces]MQS39448.1 hypothetical protein [Streptomyces katsurahamanus]MQT01281.1 hypothetical protein [Streptomyces jumonjinensis]
MARQISSAALVTGLTSAALVGVLLLAVQAGQSAPQNAVARKPAAGASPSASDQKGKNPAKPPAVPENSGVGKRVVYSLGQDRAWLVDAAGKQLSTFTVWPGNVEPALGTHSVSRRTPAITGTDGVSVENVIYFTGSGNVPIAFSAAVDGSSPKPIPGKQIGAIRVRTDDGKRLWDFTVVGSSVVVVR